MKFPGKIYLVDDEELILALLTRTLEKEGYEIRSQSNADGLRENILAWQPDVVLLDIKLPGANGMDILQDLTDGGCNVDIIMMTADKSAETAVRALRSGALDYLTKPFNLDEVRIVLAKAIEGRKLKRELEYLRKISRPLFMSDLLGNSHPMVALKEKIARLADVKVPSILVQGESGTGKELIARSIHRLMYGEEVSAAVPFVAVNCSALPDTLLESELFGYEKGAFTDAKASKGGLFELANGGTLFLDEIGEMKLSLQSKLLRALEERVVRRIGGREEIPVKVTVIATTNRELSLEVAKGNFRVDLFYRLGAFSLLAPPLRRRGSDILLLARHFLATFAQEYSRNVEGFSTEAESLLLSHPWPGNVRELKNLVRGIVVLENARTILPRHLPPEIAGLRPGTEDRKPPAFILPAEGIAFEDFKKDLIVQALARTGHNKTQAAKLLQMSFDAFRYQLKKYNLD